jgi:mannosyltransferase OCH1-like enzyme
MNDTIFLNKFTIPKNLFQIWIGPNPSPLKWMNSWKELHPDWNYILVDNEYISKFEFENKEVIQHLINVRKYDGASDVIRYELLYQFGGFLPCSDAMCLSNVDELFIGDCDEMLYVVHENELSRPDMFLPVYASTPKHPFLRLLIDEIKEMPISSVKVPYISVGNYLVSKNLYKREYANITKFPSHYFVPNHLTTGMEYTGDGKVYANQMFGNTLNRYKLGR